MKSMEALRALGLGSEAPAAAKQRVYGTILASLEMATGSTSGPHGTAPSSLGPMAAPVVVSGKLLAIATAIWLAGGVTGALLYSALRPVPQPPTRVVYVERPPAIDARPAPTGLGSAASAGLSSQIAKALPSAPQPRPGASSGASARASGGGSELARERALLDLARSAASRSEPATALAFADRHRASFPYGRLSEEREALAIRALLALGQRDQARVRAVAFRTTFPGSFLLPMLDSAFANP
jgi:hypothetical protein